VRGWRRRPVRSGVWNVDQPTGTNPQISIYSGVVVAWETVPAHHHRDTPSVPESGGAGYAGSGQLEMCSSSPMDDGRRPTNVCRCPATAGNNE
jgi:hypothetical protein